MSTEDQELKSLRDIVVEMEQNLVLARECLHAIKELEVNNIRDFTQARNMASDCLLRLDGFYKINEAGEA